MNYSTVTLSTSPLKGSSIYKIRNKISKVQIHITHSSKIFLKPLSPNKIKVVLLWVREPTVFKARKLKTVCLPEVIVFLKDLGKEHYFI